MLRKVNFSSLRVFSFVLAVAVLLVGLEMIYFRNLKTPQSTTARNRNNQLNVARNSSRSALVSQQYSAGFVPAVNKANTRYLLSLNKQLLKSSVVNNTYIGQIALVDNKEGIFGNNFQYKLALTISEESGQSLTFYYNQNNLNQVKLVNLQPQEQSFKPDLLKVGDKVEIKETLDLTKDFSNNRINIIITKQ